MNFFLETFKKDSTLRRFQRAPFGPSTRQKLEFLPWIPQRQQDWNESLRRAGLRAPTSAASGWSIHYENRMFYCVPSPRTNRRVHEPLKLNRTFKPRLQRKAPSASRDAVHSADIRPKRKKATSPSGHVAFQDCPRLRP